MKSYRPHVLPHLPAKWPLLHLALLIAVLVGATSARSESTAGAPATGEAARAAHGMLVRLCDDFGGRPTGSEANRGALDRLAEELEKLGLKAERQPFRMPGWERGEDRVELIAPLRRTLRCTALSYTQPAGPFEAPVVYIGDARSESFPKTGDGRIGLVGPGSAVPVRELVARAKERGLRAVLLSNREKGGQLLTRTGSFVGEPLPLPVISVTQEEGGWLQRLVERGETVRVRIATTSRCRETETANLLVRLPGRSGERIVIGAHFDSWDLGQGAIDNGLGIAQLFALARAWRGRDLARTVELVWFNAEELGLWGSRHQASQRGGQPIAFMANLDMAGVPIGVNVMGDASLFPPLERWHSGRACRLEKGILNNGWFGGDHVPYQLEGLRVLTFHGPIDPAAVRYYHDFADTIDKVPESLIVDSTAIIGEVLWTLIHDPELGSGQRSDADTRLLFARLGFDKRMEAIGWLSDKIHKGAPGAQEKQVNPTKPQNPSRP